MTVIPAPVSELDLHAWADGVLAPERARLVEDWLRAHPAAADEVRHWRLQADALRQLYPLPEPETMSPALRRSIGPAPVPANEACSRFAVPRTDSPGRRLASLAAALALALSVGAALAFQGARAPDGLADRALWLHETFLRAAAEPASLAGVGSAGPDLSRAGYALRGIRTVPGGGAGYFYEGQGGGRLTLLVDSRHDGPQEISVVQRGDTTLFGWRDRRASFVLVGAAGGARLLPVAHLVHAGLTGQVPDSTGENPSTPGHRPLPRGKPGLTPWDGAQSVAAM